jgi:UPF0755 protein
LRESEARARAREQEENFGRPPELNEPQAPQRSTGPVVPPPVLSDEEVAAAARPRAAAETTRPSQATAGSPVNEPEQPAESPRQLSTDSPFAFDGPPEDDPAGRWPFNEDSEVVPTKPRKRKRRFVWLWVLLGLFVVGAGAAATVWVMYEDQVRSVLGIELPNDYEGTGNGEPVTITIVEGEIGSDIATNLTEAGVTMTFDAFYDLLVSQTEQPAFIPGSYQLQQEMSAESALAALLDPANIVTSRVVIPEGSTLPQTLNRLSEGTGIPVSEFEAVAANYTALGVPESSPSLEGYLFPATYDFEPGVTATQMLQTMVDRMTQALDSAGVADEDRFRILTMAALIQKEAGSAEDMFIVSRLFYNRLEAGMNLQSDATVSYGSGGTSIHTTDAERADASNLYNTYANEGLPVGPISAPGDDAIAAAVAPADGNWLYMVLVNGETGETKFSETYEEHLVAVEEWQAWYNAHPGWDN